jgi:hypothetical protein
MLCLTHDAAGTTDVFKRAQPDIVLLSFDVSEKQGGGSAGK